jgi:hypothetical protein
MTDVHTLLALVTRFALISLFAIGGGTSSIIPLIHDVAVRELHWVDDRAFTELLAIAQAAPGPNYMLIPLIGWHVAGIPRRAPRADRIPHLAGGDRLRRRPAAASARQPDDGDGPARVPPGDRGDVDVVGNHHRADRR